MSDFSHVETSKLPSTGEVDVKPISDYTQNQYEDILQSIQRDINVLGESTSDRFAKKKALEHIYNETLSKKPPLSSFLLSRMFSTILRPTLRAVADPVEKCRELSICIIAGFVKSVDDTSPFLPYIVPSFAARLAQPELVEPAEELRLQMICALLDIVKKSKSSFAPFVEDTLKILTRTLTDMYPEVKKESCKIVIELCIHNIKPVAFYGDAVAKAILPVLHHRHSSVRVIAIEALGDAILVDAKGLDASLDTLHAISMDKAALVRETLYRTARKWMMQLTDRYTYGYKILPLLLCGMTDEMPKLRELSFGFMDEIGALYEKEWESRIKDEMDYTDGWSHLPNRPRVGSRHLARDNMQKIVVKLVDGMGNWTVDSRVKSTQILGAYLVLTEDQITGYVGNILPIIYKILSGDDQLVMNEASRVTSILGTYVDPDVTLSLLFPQLVMGGGGATNFRLGCLRTLYGLISGASSNISVHVSRIIDVLGERDLLQNENLLILYEISRCYCELLSKITTLDKELSFKILMTLAQLESSAGGEKISGYTEMREKVDGVTGVYGLFFEKSIDSITATHSSWTKHSPERRVLETVLLRVGTAVGSHLDKVLPIIYWCSSKERDYEIRESLLLMMIRLVRDIHTPLDSQGQLSKHSDALIKNIVLPNSIWHAGRKCAVLRMHTMHLLLAFLTCSCLDKSVENPCVGVLTTQSLDSALEKDLLPIIISNMEDDEVETRSTSLNVLSHLLDSSVNWDGAGLKKVYPELLKRLDDAHDSLRIQCAKVWLLYFACVRRWLDRMAPLRSSLQNPSVSVTLDANEGVVEVSLDVVHWQSMVKGLTLHLDDTNSEIQEALCETLKVGANLCIPLDVLKEHLLSIRHKHRSTRYIDAILSI
ncbi:hypothetical protein BASA60_009949 [Batrachochytrium salamandrivorans]|nr:hypothetical protein BASA60_009949 [Batrachochytrium salamandrivorans]